MSWSDQTCGSPGVQLPRCVNCGSTGHSWCNGPHEFRNETDVDSRLVMWEILKELREIKAMLKPRGLPHEP